MRQFSAVLVGAIEVWCRARQAHGQRNDDNLIKFHCVTARLDKRGWIMESYSKAGKHLGRFSSTGSKAPVSGGKGAWTHFSYGHHLQLAGCSGDFFVQHHPGWEEKPGKTGEGKDGQQCRSWKQGLLGPSMHSWWGEEGEDACQTKPGWYCNRRRGKWQQGCWEAGSASAWRARCNSYGPSNQKGLNYFHTQTQDHNQLSIYSRYNG